MNKERRSVIQRIREHIKSEDRLFVRKNIDISNQIEAILEEKGWNQKQFAKLLEKKESEVSKWLSGTHNLTLQSISKIEAVLGTDVITTPIEACKKYKSTVFVTLKVNARINAEQVMPFYGKPFFSGNSDIVLSTLEEPQEPYSNYSEVNYKQLKEQHVA